MRAPCLLLAAALLAGPPAAACVILGGAYRPSFWHRLTDWDAPAPPVVLTPAPEVRRGSGPRPDENGSGVWYSTSCDDIGLLTLEIIPPEGDRTRPNEMGYAFEVVHGTPPAALFERRPIGAVTPEMAWNQTGYTLPLSWIDGATEEQEPLDFAFVVRAVDRGGNRSAPSDTVRVVDPGWPANGAAEAAE